MSGWYGSSPGARKILLRRKVVRSSFGLVVIFLGISWNVAAGDTSRASKSQHFLADAISMPYGVAVASSNWIWLVATVRPFRPSNILPGQGLEAKIWWTEFWCIFITFWLPALNPDNRLRYLPVSLSRDVCWWFWLGRGVPEKIFDMRFLRIKVGCKNRNFENLMKYCRCWPLTCPKMTKFPRWREFQCLAVPLGSFPFVYDL